MSTDTPGFDPYYKWLGIPPKDQPPHHYRLLGVEKFETDPDVIASAADQRMSHVRTYQLGPHREVSQWILNEIAAARLCLLEPSRKAAYDDELRIAVTNELALASSLRTAMAELPPPVIAPPVFAPPIVSRPVASQPIPSRPEAASPASRPILLDFDIPEQSHQREQVGSKRLRYALVFLGAAVLSLLVLAAISRMGGNRQSPLVAAKPTASNPSRVKLTPTPEPKPPRTKPRAPRRREPKQPGVKVIPMPEVEPAQPKQPGEVPDMKKPGEGIPAEEEPADPDDDMPAEAEVEKHVIPSEDEQKEAMALVNEVYGEAISKAKLPSDKNALAQELLEAASTEPESPATQFVLLKLARDLSVASDNGKTAYAAIEAMDQAFEIDAIALKVAAIAAFASQARTKEKHALVAEQAVELLNELIERESYVHVDSLTKLAQSEVSNAGSNEQSKQIKDRIAEVENAAKSYAAVADSLVKLNDNPKDPDANLIAGKYKCFVMGDWESGLTMLAMGSDQALKTAAKTDMLASVNPGGSAKSAGDAWWGLSVRADAVTTPQLQSCAGHWYRQALPGLAGVAKTIVENRLATIKPADLKARPIPKGSVIYMTFERNAFYSQGRNSLVRDLSQRRNHGLIKGARWTADGRNGVGIEFNGNAVVECGTRGFPFGDSPRTIAFWARTNSSEREVPFSFGGNEDGDATYIALSMASRSGKAAIGNPGGRNEPVGNTIVIDGTWHHLALVYNGNGAVTLYVDGVADVTLNRRYKTTAANSFFIGSFFGMGHFFNGFLDEFVVLDRALSVDEIRELREPPAKAKLERRLADVPKTKQVSGGPPHLPRDLTAGIVGRHAAEVLSVEFDPKGKYVLSGGMDGKVQLWTLAAGKPPLQFVGHKSSVRSASVSLDGELALSAGGDGGDNAVRVWNVKTQKEIARFSETTGVMSSVGFFPDKRLVFGGSNGGKTIHVWNVKTGREAFRCNGHTGEIIHAAISPNGSVLGAVAEDRTLRIWHAKTGRELAKYDLAPDKGHAVCFSNDGSQLVVGTMNNKVFTLATDSGRRLQQFDGHTGPVYGLKFSPDNTKLLSGAFDRTVRLWDVKSGNPLATLSGHTGGIHSVAFSPDAQYGASGAVDGTVRLWDLKPFLK